MKYKNMETANLKYGKAVPKVVVFKLTFCIPCNSHPWFGGKEGKLHHVGKVAHSVSLPVNHRTIVNDGFM